jgi:hypothetical protein
MDDMRSSKLSEPELHEMHEAQRLIDQAERRQAQVLSKHLGESGEGVSLHPIDHQITVIRCGGKVCGIYVDPPGVCHPVS